MHRRAFLSLAAAGLAGTAGCGERFGPDTAPSGEPTGTTTSRTPPAVPGGRADRLEPTSLASGAHFGISTALSPGLAVVGAPTDDTATPDSGAVYLFERGSGSYQQTARLTAGSPTRLGLFGWDVAAGPDTVVVGELRQERAVVFEHENEGLTRTARLAPADHGDVSLEREVRSAGYAVAVDGDTALVSAPGSRDADGEEAGAAYLFERGSDGWAQTAALYPAVAGTRGFGRAVALDGTVALVGSPLGAESMVAVYRRTDGSWSREARLRPANGSEQQGFGAAVAVDGGTALVGRPTASGPDGPHRGSAAVFERRDGTWRRTAALTGSEGSPGDGFGSAVALSGDVAVVGTERDDENGTPPAPAYVFLRREGSWDELRRLEPDGAEDHFGASVALSGGTALAGSGRWQATTDTDAGGAAYLFGPAG